MLALIAGQGALPVLLHDHLVRQGTVPLVAELAGHPVDIPGVSALTFRVEHLGTLLKTLRAKGVEEVCFAGRIARPPLDPAAIDSDTLPFVARIASALKSGDDGALRAVLEIFEEAGFKIRGVDDLLPDLLPTPGIPTARQPSDRDRTDVLRGDVIIKSMGDADIGQSCAVVAGQALAVEVIGGTDWMLRSIAGARRPDGPPGGVFYKAAKPGQDRRIDLPVIGPDTVALVLQAGLSGIVIEAGGVMVLHPDKTLKMADENDLFLWVRRPG